MALLGDRFKNAWDAFLGRDPTPIKYSYGYSSGRRTPIYSFSGNNLKSILASVYNRIAVDSSGIKINHVRVGQDGRYEDTIASSLNWALTKSANIDQTGRNLIQEAVMMMLSSGTVAIVPVSTSSNPLSSDSYDVYELRVGKITQWYPYDVAIDVYNEKNGKDETIVLPKRIVSLIENPFYSIMNEPNSTAQRLMRILNQLDRLNSENSSGKLDLIVQLPYVIKSEAQQKQAERRRKNIEAQLTGSTYGIAYTDGTERIVQLNRSLDNNLWEQAKELQDQLYNQLGLTKSIFDGTADEKTLLNYNNRTIEPILSALTEEMERKWISKTAISQGQAIRFFKDPFKLVPVDQLAEMSDKLTRNEILTSNEVRSIIGLKPANDPKADELRNSNLNHPDEKESSVPDINKYINDTKIQNEGEKA